MTAITQFKGSVNVDQMGRVQIPKPVRDALQIEPGTRVEVVLNGNQLTIQGPAMVCQACDAPLSDDDLKFPIIRETRICKSCMKKALTSKQEE